MSTQIVTQTVIQPVLQRFALNKNTVNKLKNMKPEFGFNGLGEMVFRRTYSRDNEDWADVVIRVVEGCMSIRKEHFYRNSLYWNDSEWQQFASDMAYSLFTMEWLPPGRGLWMMGTDFTYQRGSMSLCNCGAVDTTKDFIHAAEWTMDALMNGVGVGFNTDWRGVCTQPDKTDTELFVIPDSREGWVMSLIKLLGSYIDSPKYGGKCKFPKFDYSQIREKGKPIKGFGGKASGPDPLEKLHTRVEGYLDALCKGRLQTTAKTYEEVKNDDGTSTWKEVECQVDKEYNHTRFVADVFNSIGACVVAGNVRRCLPGDAMVHTREGLIPIQDVTVGQEVLTSNGYHKILNKFEQGSQSLIRIITQDGYFRCTPNHRMAVLNENDSESYIWVEAEKLKENDKLITCNVPIEGVHTQLPKSNFSNINVPELDNDMAWFLGLFKISGHVYLGKDDTESFISITLNTSQSNFVDKITEQIKRFNKNFNIEVFSKYGDKYITLVCRNENLCRYLNHEFDGVPNFIHTANINIRLAFIFGITFKLNMEKDIVILSSEYLKFSYDVQNLLYSCGIQSRITVKSHPCLFGWENVYTLSLESNNSQFLFASKKYSYNNNYLNNLYSDEYTKEKFNITSVKEVVKDSAFDLLEPTYDIEVENMHEFFCNGYLTHNSAQISMGDVNDHTFMNLKNYTENPERSEIGWMSNNSVVLGSDQDFNDFSFIPEMASRIRDNGEPGIINLYNMQKYGRYGKEMHDDANLVNPCFSGDTLIAVADGRHAVPIRKLAEEGVDIPVYSIDPLSGETLIKWGRRPRITGENKKLLRIHFRYPHKDQHLDVTPEHEFFLNDGRNVRAKDLQAGDSIPQFKKEINGKNDYILVHNQGKRVTEHRMIAEFHHTDKFYELYDESKPNVGCCKVNNVVVHHKDEDKTNNHPDNLEVTTFGEHTTHHGRENVGEKNPMYGKKQTEETKKKIGEKCKERCKDPEYIKKLSDACTPENRKMLSEKMKKQKTEWDSKRFIEHEEEAIKTGLDYTRDGNKILINRTCENEKCSMKFRTEWWHREQPFCSVSCANTKKESIQARRIGQAKAFENKAQVNFMLQASIYIDLVERFGEDNVYKKDWENECKSQNVSFRFNASSENPWIPKGWNHFKEMVEEFNHQVDYIEELNGLHTVYDLTVDDTHTVCVVTKASEDFKTQIGLVTFNCSEISLCSFELCNLSEIFPNRCKDEKVFQKALEYATFYSSTVSLLPTHRPETNAIVAKNRRIGVSISGIAQWVSFSKESSWGEMNYTRLVSILRKGYKIVRDYNALLAEQAGIPPSIRVTTVKPSGSISLLAGATPGVHYPVSRYAIRRVRIADNSPLIKPLQDSGIPYEKDSYSDNTFVFEFTIDHGEVRPCEEVSPWEQFSVVAMMQRFWSDNMVSATIYFDKVKDGPDVEGMLAMYIPVLKSVSMLPHSGHGYAQAPYEPITKEQYEERCRNFKMPDFSSIQNNVPEGSKFCTGDTCER